MKPNAPEAYHESDGFGDFKERKITDLEQTRRGNNEIEINLADVFQILLSKWVYILIAGLAAAILVGAFTKFFIKKKYTAYTSMYIYASADEKQTGSITSSELTAADNLIKTYQVIVKSNTVLDVIAERFNTEHPEYAQKGIVVTPSALSGMTSIKVPTGTKLIEIDVKTGDPVLSADIANTFAKYAPTEIVRITKAGGVEIVDYATVPKSASSPNLSRNVLVALAAGIVAAAVFFVLRAYLDTTIYGSEEVLKVSRCPVIGTVPMIVIGTEEITPWEVSLREEITNEE